MTDRSQHPPRPKPTTLRLLGDPWVATVIAVAVGFAVMPYLRWLGTDAKWYLTNLYSTIVLLALAIGAVFHGLRRVEPQRARYFWRLLGLGLSAWMAGEVAASLVVDVDNAAAGVAVDALYLCFYLAFLFALDLRPQVLDGEVRIRPLRVLTNLGRSLFVIGIFAYFVVIPTSMGVDEYLTWVPSFSFYVILDLYLAWRFFLSSSRSPSRHWRITFALLAVALICLAATDSIDLAWISSVLPDSIPRAFDVFWYAPMVLIVIASRGRRDCRISVEPPDTDDLEDRIRGIPLLLYSVGFALLHLALSMAQSQPGPLLTARVWLVILCLLLFGLLNIVQNSIIERRNRLQRLRRKEAEDQIRSIARQDPLTGLLNRRALEEEFSRALARADRTGLPLALLFIDLDHFKTVNDTHGHHAGDSVLREAAARIRALTREVDTLARYGGDEFVVVLEALEGRADAHVVGNRIIDGFQLGFQFESTRIQLSASIGIALFPEHGPTKPQLFEAADRAMYRAKESGGSGLEFA